MSWKKENTENTKNDSTKNDSTKIENKKKPLKSGTNVDDVEMSVLGCRLPVMVLYGKARFSVDVGFGCSLKHLIQKKLHNEFIIKNCYDGGQFGLYMVNNKNYIDECDKLDICDFISGGKTICVIDFTRKYYQVHIIYRSNNLRRNKKCIVTHSHYYENSINSVINFAIMDGAVWIESHYSYAPQLSGNLIPDQFWWINKFQIPRKSTVIDRKSY